MILEGIDVSVYQGAINWRSVRQAGKHFAFIKATEGLSIVDPQFGANWENAASVGMHRIAYHFYYDTLDPREQAHFHHETVRQHGKFRWGDGTMLDVEEVGVTTARATIDGIQAYVVDAVREIDKQLFIYTDPNTWINLLGNPTITSLRDRPLYLADLGPYIPSLNTWPHGLSVLQYSFHGHCPGIAGEVDLDRFYGSEAQLKKLLRP